MSDIAERTAKRIVSRQREVAMSNSAEKAAKKALPGWSVVPAQKVKHAVVKAEGKTPSLKALRKVYGVKEPKAGHGLSAASSLVESPEFVVMEPPPGKASLGRKVVVVANGKPVAIQG